MKHVVAVLLTGFSLGLMGCPTPIRNNPDTSPPRDGTTGNDARTNMDMGTTMCLGMGMPAGSENTPDLCSDGCSNDGDTFADCEDRDCCGARTNCPTGTYCGNRDGGSCTSTSDTENTPEQCGDGVDNNCDGFADCSDFDCCSQVACDPSTPCGRRGDGGTAGDAGASTDMGMMSTPDMGMSSSWCVLGPENTFAACTDGCDNDGNTYTDCNDRVCCSILVAMGRVCPGGARNMGGTYCGTRGTWPGQPTTMDNPACTPTMPPPAYENTPSACTDAVDNNCNGFIDCDELGCCSQRDEVMRIHACPSNSVLGRTPGTGTMTMRACDVR